MFPDGVRNSTTPPAAEATGAAKQAPIVRASKTVKRNIDSWYATGPTSASRFIRNTQSDVESTGVALRYAVAGRTRFELVGAVGLLAGPLGIALFTTPASAHADGVRVAAGDRSHQEHRSNRISSWIGTSQERARGSAIQAAEAVSAGISPAVRENGIQRTGEGRDQVFILADTQINEFRVAGEMDSGDQT